MSLSNDFRRRVQRIDMMEPLPGKRFYRLIQGDYVPNGGERFGPNHHILVDVWDAQGNRKLGVPVRFFWQGGDKVVLTNKTSGPYAADFAMHAAGYAYGAAVGSYAGESDQVFGMGLGRIGSETFGQHVTFLLIFQEITGGSQPILPGEPDPGGGKPRPTADEKLKTVAELARKMLSVIES